MTSNKKIIKTVLALLLGSALCCQGVLSQEIEDNPYDGNSLESFIRYTREKSSIATGTDLHTVTDSSLKKQALTSLRTVSFESVLIPDSIRGEKVKYISPTLSSSTSLRTVFLSDSTVAILSSSAKPLDRAGAFKNSTVEYFIPSSHLRYVGNNAFYGSSLKYFFVPFLTKHLGSYSFAYCRNLSEFSVYGHTSIGDGAFAGCEALDKVYLSENVTRVGLDAFIHTPFYDSLTEEFGLCGDILIKYNGKEENDGSVVIPEGVRIIADGVFAGRASIKEVHFPSSLEYIGNSAFRSAQNLTVLVFNNDDESSKKNVTVGVNAFEGCPRLDNDSLTAINAMPVDSRNITVTENNAAILLQSPVSTRWLISKTNGDLLKAAAIQEELKRKREEEKAFERPALSNKTTDFPMLSDYKKDK